MRITSIHAANALTFEKVTVPIDPDGLTVFVGPNGSGKTNLFRVVRQLVGGLSISRYPPLGNREESLAILASWQRDPTEPLVLELGLEWQEDEEHELLAQVLRLALANPQQVGWGSDLYQTLWQRPSWLRFVDSLSQVVDTNDAAFLFHGTLGLRYVNSGDLVVYYRLSDPEDLCWILTSQVSGIIPGPSPDFQRQVPNSSLPQMWLRSLPEDQRNALLAYLAIDGEPQADAPVVSFDFRSILSATRDGAQATPNNHLNWVLQVAVESNSQSPESITNFQRKILDTTDSGYRNIGLGDVIDYLLRDRVLVTEDLLSPPADQYGATSWWKQASPLRSRHLGAHLLALKLGNKENRERFAAIQRTFAKLSSRGLEITMRHWPPVESPQVRGHVMIQIVQDAQGDRTSMPLHESGSGLVELAYVSTVLNQPRSHVILLDEPGRALHPQAQLALKAHILNRASQIPDLRSQMLMVTHSPYLVPIHSLHRVYRVWRKGAGTTTVGKVASSHTPAKGDRWSRSPNLATSLFSTVVLLVDGATELGALPIWYEQLYKEPPEARSASILSIDGKTNLGNVIEDLDGSGVSWIALVDGDSIQDVSGNIWRELNKAGRIDTADVEDLIAKDFDDQVQILRDRHSVYVSGESQSENFEAMLEKAFKGVRPPGRKVQSAQIYARQSPSCPDFLKPALMMLRQTALQDGPDGSGGQGE